MITDKLSKKLRDIKLFVTDFDGIHTDGTVNIDQNGVESVRCSRKDGLGYAMLAKAGISACVISKEANPVVLRRCEKIGIPCYQKVADGQGKLEILQRVTHNLGLKYHQVLYMGDDINDLEPLEFAGVAITVNDGHKLLLKRVDYVTTCNGGEHAIREVCEMILLAKGLPLVF